MSFHICRMAAPNNRYTATFSSLSFAKHCKMQATTELPHLYIYGWGAQPDKITLLNQFLHGMIDLDFGCMWPTAKIRIKGQAHGPTQPHKYWPRSFQYSSFEMRLEELSPSYSGTIKLCSSVMNISRWCLACIQRDIPPRDTENSLRGSPP